MTVYSMDKRWQYCQATSFMSDFDDVNFPVSRPCIPQVQARQPRRRSRGDAAASKMGEAATTYLPTSRVNCIGAK
jgi:hypothetical protein